MTQGRHSCIAANYPSFDRFVGSREQRGRHDEAESLAVLRLITSSYLVFCSMGRSTGFAPLRIRPA
jgi:hypothetical protein